MRPARKGPENMWLWWWIGREGLGFNEAGPQGAGKPADHRRPGVRRRVASMRPARKGPENSTCPDAQTGKLLLQ